MSDLAIRVEHLSKQYHLGVAQPRYETFRDAIINAVQTPVRILQGKTSSKPETFWALDDINFEIKHGEAVGIIGRNGAGKSTLLKILSRITRPTRGRADLYGRVGSLLEVGTGFHPELTGRENIYLNGAILGMRNAEIQRKFDEIVDFAEIEKFLDTPVKFYSSGMYVRLAFAVAAHLEPDILVVDEVLAVGDTQFQKKSMGKMGEVAKSGRTVLFVSHNMGAVSVFCDRAIYLKAGKVEMIGDVHSVVGSYVNAGRDIFAHKSWSLETAPGNEAARLRSVSIKNNDGQLLSSILARESFEIEFQYWNREPGIKLSVTIVLINEEGHIVFSSISNHEQKWHGQSRPIGLYKSVCTVPSNLLAPGSYDITVLICADHYSRCFREDNVAQFSIVDSGEVRGDYFGGFSGVVRPMLNWKTEAIEEQVEDKE
jgi:lipopolysaccharide transport system ATP-binding protein